MFKSIFYLNVYIHRTLDSMDFFTGSVTTTNCLLCVRMRQVWVLCVKSVALTFVFIMRLTLFASNEYADTVVVAHRAAVYVCAVAAAVAFICLWFFLAYVYRLLTIVDVFTKHA